MRWKVFLFLPRYLFSDAADGGGSDSEIGSDFLQGKFLHDVGTTLHEFFIAGLGIGSVEIEETGVGLEKESFTNSFSDVHEMRVFLIQPLDALTLYHHQGAVLACHDGHIRRGTIQAVGIICHQFALEHTSTMNCKSAPFLYVLNASIQKEKVKDLFY